ncbi:hypothetical protein [Nocardioides dongkuii]|uniref:hypothetical protein n=1 Tax=Nocardioides dongkuii TaxID=2760089 RepID=UPI0015F93DA8|nr:hypothetical protein [Nocardioides dongkuii]
MSVTMNRTRKGRRVSGELQWDGTRWRRWTGRRWARAAYSLRPSRLEVAEPLHRDPEESVETRQRVLGLAVEDQVLTNGATVVHEGPSGVVLSYRRRPAHAAHAIMTLLTGGLWAVVWAACALGEARDRVLLEVDPWGHVWATQGLKR